MFKNPDKAPKQYTPGEALQKIAAFCAYQERTQKEVEQKLKSYGLDEDEAGEIIIRLSREKLLDEERFAQAFVRGHYRHKKVGPPPHHAGPQAKRHQRVLHQIGHEGD